MIIATFPSINIPRMSRNRFITNRNAIGLSTMPVTYSVAPCGILSHVRIQPNADPAAIINKMEEEECYGIFLMFSFCGLILSVIFLGCDFSNIVTCIFNPEYAAIKDLMQMIK